MAFVPPPSGLQSFSFLLIICLPVLLVGNSQGPGKSGTLGGGLGGSLPAVASCSLTPRVAVGKPTQS